MGTCLKSQDNLKDTSLGRYTESEVHHLALKRIRRKLLDFEENKGNLKDILLHNKESKGHPLGSEEHLQEI